MNIATVCQLGVDRYTARKPDRVRVLLNTRLRIAGKPDMDVDVHNISNRGFMAEADVGLLIGSDALLYLPGVGWSLANVRWSLGQRFGGRFSDAINMREFWRANPPVRLSYVEDVTLN